MEKGTARRGGHTDFTGNPTLRQSLVPEPGRATGRQTGQPPCGIGAAGGEGLVLSISNRENCRNRQRLRSRALLD